MQEYLSVTEIIDWQHPEILQLAQQLATSDTITTAKACFEWVRDHIYHSSDYKMNPVTVDLGLKPTPSGVLARSI